MPAAAGRTRTVLVAGTASHVGKSTVAAGLCRLLSDRGVDVAPFKAQNMSNNARAVPKSAPRSQGGDVDRTVEFGEIGISQYVQARAARVPAETDHNPVLLKPRGSGESQLVIDGESVSHLAAGDYYEGGWHDARDAVEAAYRRLAAANDVVVAEGAGSIAEINLHHRDLANVEIVRIAAAVANEDGSRSTNEAHFRSEQTDIVGAPKPGDITGATGAADVTDKTGVTDETGGTDETEATDGADTTESADDPEVTGSKGVDVLLVADIERGGVFASLVGSLELVPPVVRDRIAGAVITKFRGDPTLLEPGLDRFEAMTGVPVLGVIPYDDPGLPAEDSVSLPAVDDRAVRGADDGVEAAHAVTIAVPRLPRISNATDLEPLAVVPGVRVVYVPLDGDLSDADAVVVPGTKNTVDDLIDCRDAGFDGAIRSFDGPIVGLCGGYQLLGERVRNADVESATIDAADATVDAFGLLPLETVFDADKRVIATDLELHLDTVGPMTTVDEAGSVEVSPIAVSGYEIHMGETRRITDGSEGASCGTEKASPATAASNASLRMPSSLTTPFVDPAGGRSGVALGASTDRVLGTYLHGLFENATVRRAFVAAVRDHAGVDPPASAGDPTRSPYDRAAELVEANVDMRPLNLPGIGGDPTKPTDE